MTDARKPLRRLGAVVVVVQLAVAGLAHALPVVAARLPLAQTGLGAAAGYLAASRLIGGYPAALRRGLALGAIPAFLATVALVILGDQPPNALMVGSGSAAVAGLVGGLAGRMFVSRSAKR